MYDVKAWANILPTKAEMSVDINTRQLINVVPIVTNVSLLDDDLLERTDVIILPGGGIPVAVLLSLQLGGFCECIIGC